jgi:hypothetical protein
MELISFIPQIATYLIYYPETFLLDEADDGIVSITSPETASNLTLSGYQVNQQVTEEILLGMFNDMTKGYEPRSDFRTLETNQDLFLERAYIKDEVSWVWWGLSKDNQIIIASINSENGLSDEDYNLYRFMIDKMEIYPSEFEQA